MTRSLCSGCHRPINACICSFITDIANDIHVVVLQHPSEVSHTKGTVALLSKSLRSCQVLVGENFTNDVTFFQVMNDYQPFLLYPSEHAETLTYPMGLSIELKNDSESLLQSDLKKKPSCLVILDGTWKKAYKMFRLSTNLQQLPQISLPENLANAGQYHIRKVAKKNALSSLEASCYALAILEKNSNSDDVTPNNAGKYQLLLDNFSKFNQFQLSFRPEQRSFEETND